MNNNDINVYIIDGMIIDFIIDTEDILINKLAYIYVRSVLENNTMLMELYNELKQRIINTELLNAYILNELNDIDESIEDIETLERIKDAISSLET